MTIHTENPKAKPSKALSRDSHRPTLQLARLIKRNGSHYLEATDSYQAVRVPITTNGDEVPDDELLPAAAVKVLDATDGELDFKDGVIAHGSDGETVHYEAAEASTKFPDLEELWPPDPKRPFRFGLNVRLLKALADGLGTEEIEIVVDLSRKEKDPAKGYLRPYVVRALGCGGEGILMPVRLKK